MDEIDYKAVSANLATQMAEQIYQVAQWRNLAEKVMAERDNYRSRLEAVTSAPETSDNEDETP